MKLAFSFFSLPFPVDHLRFPWAVGHVTGGIGESGDFLSADALISPKNHRTVPYRSSTLAFPAICPINIWPSRPFVLPNVHPTRRCRASRLGGFAAPRCDRERGQHPRRSAVGVGYCHVSLLQGAGRRPPPTCGPGSGHSPRWSVYKPSGYTAFSSIRPGLDCAVAGKELDGERPVAGGNGSS